MKYIRFFAKFITHSHTTKKRFAATVLVLLLDIYLATKIPYFFKNIVTNPQDEFIIISAILLGTFWTIDKINAYLQEIIFFPIINYAIQNITFQVAGRIHKIPFGIYQTLSIAELQSSIRRIGQSVRTFLKVAFLALVPTVGKFIIAFMTLLKLGLFGVSFIFMTLAAVVILYFILKHYIKIREVAWNLTDEVAITLNDNIINSSLLRQNIKPAMQQLRQKLCQEAEAWHEANLKLNTMHILITLLIGATLTAIFALSANLVQQGTLSAGEFVLIHGQLLAAFIPLKTLCVESRQLAESVIDIKKVIAILELPQDNSKPNFCEKNALLFKKVNFNYPKQQLFSNLNLKIPLFTKMAITGPNGIGKSTLLQLMAQVIKPQQGEINVHSNMLYIPAEVKLFNNTLLYNLTFGLSHVSTDKIEEVITMLKLNHLPLATLVGEQGIRLSTGEKQRIQLARALLIKPMVLLLDETLDAIDKDSAAAIISHLFKEIPTIIYISHRKDLINKAYLLFDVTTKQLIKQFSSVS